MWKKLPNMFFVQKKLFLGSNFEVICDLYLIVIVVHVLYSVEWNINNFYVKVWYFL